MATLRAPSPVASRPVIALVMVLCLAYSPRPFATSFGLGHGTEKRTNYEWKKLGTAALEEIGKKDDWGMVSSDAKEWLEKVARISRETDCTEERAARLVSWRSKYKTFKKFHSVLNDYIELYLSECGLEEQFKQAIAKLKQVEPEHWGSSRYKSLRKYLEGKDWSAGEAMKLFSIIRDILDIDSNPNCSDEHMIKLVLKRVHVFCGDICDFLDGYAGLHSQKCGFEDLFKKAIGTLKEVSPEHWSSHSYKTMYEFLKRREEFDGEAKRLLSIVRNILKLASNFKGVECTDRYLTNNVISKIPRKDDERRKCDDDYVKLYLEKCGFEERFEKAINELKRVDPKYKHSDDYQSLHEYIKNMPEYAVEELLSIVNDILELKSNSKQIVCTDERMIDVLMEQAAKRDVSEYKIFNPKFLDGYDGLYAERCGLNERFNRAIANIEQVSPKRWKSATHSTLHGYLGRKIHYWNQVEELRLLVAIREISKPSSITDEIDCTDEHVTELAKLFFRNSKLHPELFDDLYDFLFGYYEFYMEKCGFEERFQRAIRNSRSFSDKLSDLNKISRPLSSYLTSLEWTDPNMVVPLLSLIKEVSDLKDTSADIDCTEERETKVLELFIKTYRPKELHLFVSGYFVFYLKKCGFNDILNRVIDNIESFSPGLGSISHQKVNRYLWQWHGDVKDIKEPMSIIEGLADLGNISRETDCSDELETNLLTFIDKSKPAYPEVEGIVDIYFARFLDKCGYEEGFAKALDNMKRVWQNHSDYPETSPKLMSHFSEHRFIDKSDRLGVLTAVKDLSALENFSKEKHCNDELLAKLLAWNAKNDEIGYYQVLLKDQFAFYLDECGFEQMFQELSEGKTLFSFLWDKHLQVSWPQRVTSTIRELNYVQDISEEPDCPRELIDNLMELHLKDKQDNSELYELVETFLARYQDKCDLIDMETTV